MRTRKSSCVLLYSIQITYLLHQPHVRTDPVSIFPPLGSVPKAAYSLPGDFLKQLLWEGHLPCSLGLVFWLPRQRELKDLFRFVAFSYPNFQQKSWWFLFICSLFTMKVRYIVYTFPKWHYIIKANLLGGGIFCEVVLYAATCPCRGCHSILWKRFV